MHGFGADLGEEGLLSGIVSGIGFCFARASFRHFSDIDFIIFFFLRGAFFGGVDLGVDCSISTCFFAQYVFGVAWIWRGFFARKFRASRLGETLCKKSMSPAKYSRQIHAKFTRVFTPKSTPPKKVPRKSIHAKSMPNSLVNPRRPAKIFTPNPRQIHTSIHAVSLPLFSVVRVVRLDLFAHKVLHLLSC